MRLPRGAPVRMTTEGVGETSGLADALSFLMCLILRSRTLARRHRKSALADLRTKQSNLG